MRFPTDVCTHVYLHIHRYFFTNGPACWLVATQQVQICKSSVVSTVLKCYNPAKQLFSLEIPGTPPISIPNTAVTWPLSLGTEAHGFCMVVPKKKLMDTRVLANILYLNWCVSLMLQQFLWSSRILLWHPVVLNHTYLFFKMQTIHWPSRQEKNVQIVDTTCPWVSKVGDGVRKHHFSLVFFLYILDETPKEFTAAYDFDKRFLIFFGTFRCGVTLLIQYLLFGPAKKPSSPFCLCSHWVR